MEFERGAARCGCDVCVRWERWVRGEEPDSTLQYEILTSDLIRALAAWVRASSVAGAGAPSTEPLRVLEVGAGDGRLSHYLREALRENSPASDGALSVVVVATDSGERSIPACAPGAVEVLDYRDALRRHAPQLVLCCWMPLGQDWTAAFRECASVSSFLLLGEADDGCSGQPWATWGFDADGAQADHSSSGDSSGTSDAESSCSEDPDSWKRVYQHSAHTTPWGLEGWTRRAVPSIGEQQIGRTDAPWCARRHSTAVCFSRGEATAPPDAPPGIEADRKRRRADGVHAEGERR